MMWFETKEIEKRTEKVRGGEGEPTLKMCDKNHPLTGLRGGDQLVAGSATDDLGADPAGFGQPFEVMTAHLGALPAARGKLRHIQFRSCKGGDAIRLGLERVHKT